MHQSDADLGSPFRNKARDVDFWCEVWTPIFNMVAGLDPNFQYGGWFELRGSPGFGFLGGGGVVGGGYGAAATPPPSPSGGWSVENISTPPPLDLALGVNGRRRVVMSGGGARRSWRSSSGVSCLGPCGAGSSAKAPAPGTRTRRRAPRGSRRLGRGLKWALSEKPVPNNRPRNSIEY